MIQANELRLGNLLFYDSTKGDYDYAVMDWGDLRWISEDHENFNKLHTAIPVDEYWLLKLGLYSIGINRWRVGWYNYVIEYCFNMYVVKYITFTNQLIQIGMEIKYVHQMQNVIYFLTGTELQCSL